ncbi:MAG: C-GCAxxG-C-C family protein [Collinsella sp.]|nr:C-GCAxxG-C-C family protein [Collinsella sp.]
MALNKDEIILDREALKARAAELHETGFNCAQSVLCALAPALGIDAETAFRLAEGFGAGMGGLTETCGAISGAVMALGQTESDGMEAHASKGRTYRLARELCRGFQEMNGSTVCRELKGVGSETGPLRSCAGCIDDAVDLYIDIVGGQGAR